MCEAIAEIADGAADLLLGRVGRHPNRAVEVGIVQRGGDPFGLLEQDLERLGLQIDREILGETLL